MKTVYILGAGFSRPLGGPLLSDLFTTTSWEIATRKFPDSGLERDLPAKWAAELYRDFLIRHDRPDPFNKVDSVRFWSDAEEFLEALELCVHNKTESPRSPRLSSWLLPKIEGLVHEGQFSQSKYDIKTSFAFLPELFRRQLGNCLDPNKENWSLRLQSSFTEHQKPWLSVLLYGAKRMLAAECSAFFDKADVDFDRWSPFRTWIARLNTNDTVVTFNYDLVLETISKKSGLDNLQFLLPGEYPGSDKAVVCKLHGSVDWKLKDNRIEKVDSPVPFAISCKDSEAVMGTPGPEKLAGRNNALRPLWDLAGERIHSADRIVFLGYRMPPTDACARRFLAESISNHQESRVRVQIVLGPPEVSDVHARRLERILLALTNSSSRVERLPLGAEDFLDLEGPLTERGDAPVGR